MDFEYIQRAFRDINTHYSPLLLESNHLIEDKRISWPSYKAGIYGNTIYGTEYQRLIDTRQYSYLLFDKSFIQMFYEKNNNVITKAKLAYYPVPLKITNAYDDILQSAEESGLDILEDLFFGVESWLDKGIDVVNTSHIRLDYDSKVTSHSKCHLQVGAINDIRIDSQKLLNPFVFFDWIVSKLNFDEYSGLCTKQKFQADKQFHMRKFLETDIPAESHYFLSN
ncbi:MULTISPECIES: DUF2290 domain-containing protein [unclassified Pseudoalteromonas]|uniref:DUF2290 domain-containing protein n=1 Tax=unclassified Pseudoalteromonas TaxID=194690 RepID=UPI0015FEF1C4|nr:MULTISPECIES: DUF2290 domain-containing protein [unclassified Pseudoalteromonas]MBB1334915.1 DUF2290 domain-containing protein [Pseudoalteromonas sp. SR41-6]MBB1461551.1 DUF2290 domain-containing protein [Pseudoalteromonas sp. SG41-8]